MRTDDIEQMMNRWRWFSYGFRLALAPCASNVPGRMFRRNHRAQSPFLFAQSHDPPPGSSAGSRKPPPPPLPSNPAAKPATPSPSEPNQTPAVDPAKVATQRGLLSLGCIAILAMLLIPLALLGVAFYVFGFRESVDTREPTERVRPDLLDDPFSDPDGPFGPSNRDDPFASSGEGLSPAIENNNIPPEDFKIDVSFTHPILGDITEQKWLIDGTEIAIDVLPQALENDSEKIEDGIESQLVSFTLKLNDDEKATLKKEIVIENGVRLTYEVDDEDIGQLIASQSQSGSNIHRLAVQAKILGKDVEVRREVEVPHIAVILQRQHLLAILEPIWFAGKLANSKRLYEFEDRGSWMDRFQELQPGRDWYAHDSTNRLASSMLLFGSDPSRDAVELRKFLALNYPGELDPSFEEFKRYAAGPIAEMLDSIRLQMKGDEEGFRKGLVSLDLMNKLLLKQAEVMEGIQTLSKTEKQNVLLAESIWQEPREIVRQVEETLQISTVWSRLYAPPFSREKEITSFIVNWVSRPVVQESWKKVMDKTKGLEKMIDRPILKTLLLTLESEDDELVIPVVVAYQPGKGSSLLQAPVNNDPGKGGVVDDPFGGTPPKGDDDPFGGR